MQFISSPWRIVISVLTVVTGALISWYTNGQSLMGIDDANIYMVYMQNLADGYGFVYNAEGERVEGFTSLLWTLLGALVFTFSDTPNIVLLTFNIFFVSVALYHVSALIDYALRIQTGPSALSILPFAILIIIPGYFEWTVLSLLETGIWSSAIILISTLILRTHWNTFNKKSEALFILLLVLLVLIRPESMVWVPFFILSRSTKSLIDGGSFSNALWLLIRGLSVSVVLFGILTLWRLTYFGFPLPNTFYAKVSGDYIENIMEGIRYCYNGIKLNPFIIMSTMVSLFYVSSFVKDKRLLNIIVFSVSITAVTMLFPLVSGGDHFDYARFFQPTMPLMLIALSLVGWRNETKVVLLTAILLMFWNEPNFFSRIRYQSAKTKKEWLIANSGRSEGRQLNSFFEGLNLKPEIGVLTAGGFAFTYDGPVNDLLGLNNVDMAHYDREKNIHAGHGHASFSVNTFLEQKPDILRIGWLYSKNAEIELTFVDQNQYWLTYSLCSIQNNEAFNQAYQFVSVFNSERNEYIRGFMTSSFLSSLPEGYEIKTTKNPFFSE